jgi:hypothetical protein
MTASRWHEDVLPGAHASDSRRSWYCVSWPDGSCLHLHSLSALSALAWTRAENGAPAIKGKRVTADTCHHTGQTMPVDRRSIA